MAKTETLVYDFTTDDGTFVDVVAGGTITGGVASMPFDGPASAPCKQTPENWDLTESEVDIELVGLGTVESDEAYFCFGVAGGVFDASQVEFVVGRTAVAGEYYLVPREINSSGGNVAGEPFIDVVAADVRWLRFRHTGTTVFWETSPDRSTWTIRRQKTPVTGFPSTAGRIKVGSYNFTGNGVAAAEFDNVNGGAAAGEHFAASTTIGLDLGLSASATMQAGSSSTIGLDLGLSGGDTAQSTATAELGLALDVAGTASQQSSAAASLGVDLDLVGAATAQAAASIGLGLELGLAADASMQASASTTLGLELGISGTAVSDEPVIGAIRITNASGPDVNRLAETTGLAKRRTIAGVARSRAIHGAAFARSTLTIGTGVRPTITGPARTQRPEPTGPDRRRRISGAAI